MFIKYIIHKRDIDVTYNNVIIHIIRIIASYISTFVRRLPFPSNMIGTSQFLLH